MCRVICQPITSTRHCRQTEISGQIAQWLMRSVERWQPITHATMAPVPSADCRSLYSSSLGAEECSRVQLTGVWTLLSWSGVSRVLTGSGELQTAWRLRGTSFAEGAYEAPRHTCSTHCSMLSAMLHRPCCMQRCSMRETYCARILYTWLGWGAGVGCSRATIDWLKC